MTSEDALSFGGGSKLGVDDGCDSEAAMEPTKAVDPESL